MRFEFDSFSDMICYMGKLIIRNTDIEKKCQYCGKPAQIKYNRKDPYMIQMVCKDCKVQRGFTNKKDMFDDIPLIDVKAHIITSNMREKLDGLTPDIENKIQFLLNTNLGKCEALKKLGVSSPRLDKWLTLYEVKDPDIKKKLKSKFKERAGKKVSSRSLRDAVHNVSNNLSKIKYERHITNADIVDMSKGRIHKLALSMICRDKTNPKIKTKCMLAEILDVSVTDIFPNDYLYKDIHNYTEYKNYYNSVRKRYNDYLKSKYNSGEDYIVANISKKTGISIPSLYEFANNRTRFNHKRLVKILELLDE